LAYIILYSAAPITAGFFATPELTRVLRVLGLPAMLTVIRTVPESLLRKRLPRDRLVIAEVVAALVAIPPMMILAWCGAGVWALVRVCGWPPRPARGHPPFRTALSL